MKIRTLYLLITTVALLISILFGSLSVINGANTQKLKNTEYEYSAKINECESLLQPVQQQIIQKQQEKDLLQAQVDRLEKIESYKTTPTAFLTFDDGPNTNTARILDVLKEYNIKATFYVIASQIEGSETMQAIMKRTVDEGHAIAIHTYSHSYQQIYKSVDAYFEDLYKAGQIIKDATGIETKLVRLPGGTASAKDLCKKHSGSDDTFPQIINRLEKEGYSISDWNIDTRDWESSSTVDGIVSSVRRVAEAWKNNNNGYRTALILMHNWEKTVSALPRMIQNLQELGFNFEEMRADGYAYVQRKGR